MITILCSFEALLAFLLWSRVPVCGRWFFFFFFLLLPRRSRFGFGGRVGLDYISLGYIPEGDGTIYLFVSVGSGSEPVDDCRA